MYLHRSLLLAVAMLLAAGAGAGARTSGTFSIPNLQVTAGAPVAYDYAGEHVPKDVRVTLQRQFGSSYGDVKVLRRAGPGTAPGLPIGRFGFRLAFWRGHKLLSASKPVFVLSYGTVTIGRLCRGSGWVKTCSVGSAQIGQRSFNYDAYDSSHGSHAAPSAITASRSSCRSGTVAYALSSSESSTTTVNAEVDDSALGPQTDYAPYGAVETFKFSLSSPSWHLVFWESPADPQGSSGPAVLFSGSFSCWTASGIAPAGS